MKFLSLYGLALALLLLLSCSFDDDLSWTVVDQRGKLRIGITGNYYPMNFYDPEHDQESGLDVEVAREACRRLGVKPVFQRIFWPEKFQELASSRIDCIWSGMTITPERKELVLFTEPYMENRQVILVQDSSHYRHIADLAGKRISILASSSVQRQIQTHPALGGNTKINPQVNHYMALLLLFDGKVDAIAIDETIAASMIGYTNEKAKRLRMLDENFGSEQFGVAFRKADRSLRNRLQGVLADMRKDGTLGKIEKKWLFGF